jgi:hypothetical protein
MLRASAVTVCLLAVACGTPAASEGAAGTPRSVPTATTPRATPTASLPAGAHVAEGASTQMYLGRTRGTLDIRVEIERVPGAAATASVDYQRNGACKREKVSGGNYVVNCPVLWKQTRHIAANAFTLDPGLANATLNDTVRGLKVKVIWTAFRDTQRQANQNGFLLLETRDAVVDARWGKDHWVEPKTADVPSGLYRRVSAATAK